MTEQKTHRATSLTQAQLDEHKKTSKSDFKKNQDKIFVTIKHFGELVAKLYGGVGSKPKNFEQRVVQKVPDPNDPKKFTERESTLNVTGDYVEKLLASIKDELLNNVADFVAAQDRTRRKKTERIAGSYDDKKYQLGLGIRAIIEVDKIFADFLVAFMRRLQQRQDNGVFLRGVPERPTDVAGASSKRNTKNVKYLATGATWTTDALTGLQGNLPGLQGRYITSTNTAHYILRLYAMDAHLYSASRSNLAIMANPAFRGLDMREVATYEMKRDTLALNDELKTLLANDPRTPGQPQPGNMWVVTTPPDKKAQEERKLRKASERKSNRAPGEKSEREKRLENPTPDNFDQKQLVQIVHLFQLQIGAPVVNGQKNFTYRKVPITTGPGVGQGVWLESVLPKKPASAEQARLADATKETRQQILANENLVNIIYGEMENVTGYYGLSKQSVANQLKTGRPKYLKTRPKEVKETKGRSAAAKEIAIVRIALEPPGIPIKGGNAAYYPLSTAARAMGAAAQVVNVPGAAAPGSNVPQPGQPAQASTSPNAPAGGVPSDVPAVL